MQNSSINFLPWYHHCLFIDKAASLNKWPRKNLFFGKKVFTELPNLAPKRAQKMSVFLGRCWHRNYTVLFHDSFMLLFVRYSYVFYPLLQSSVDIPIFGSDLITQKLHILNCNSYLLNNFYTFHFILLFSLCWINYLENFIIHNPAK